jgi:hypothetical protein
MSLIPGESHRSPSLLHLFLSWFLWLIRLQHIVTPKRHKELRFHSHTKTHAKNKCPKLYLHNASYTQPILNGIDFCFRLPITGIMYFGLRQIAALPARRTWEPKPQKKQAKVCKLPTCRPAVKKQGQGKRR